MTFRKISLTYYTFLYMRIYYQNLLRCTVTDTSRSHFWKLCDRLNFWNSTWECSIKCQGLGSCTKQKNQVFMPKSATRYRIRYKLACVVFLPYVCIFNKQK